MTSKKVLRLSILALGLACAFPAGSQQSGSSSQQGSSQQSAAGGQSAPGASEQRSNEGTDWGWLGLLGLIGLAGLRRRDDRDEHRGAARGV
jgi:hypothetical protein